MRTLVVGGGIAGLAAAHALARAGDDVRLLESAGRVGGVIRSTRTDGFLLEHGPNTVRPTHALVELARGAGLEMEMLFSDPDAPRYLAWNGALHALPSSLRTILSTALLSPRGKLRLFAEPFVGRRPAREGRNETDETVDEFFTRRFGAEVAQRFVAPFVSGIFAGDPARLSAQAVFPSLARAQQEYGSLTAWAIRGRGSKGAEKPSGVRGLMSFRNGLETLPRALAASLGERVETGVRVVDLRPEQGSWRFETANGSRRAERVLLACPAPEAAGLVAGFAPETARVLNEIPQAPIAILHLAWPSAALPAPLRGFGHLVIRHPGLRILGAVWSSSLFPGRAPEGWELVTAFAGGTTDPGAPMLSDEELAACAAREISPLLRAAQAPRLLGVTRWAQAIPQYEQGHAERIAALSRAESRFPGLQFLGSYRGGISVGDVICNAALAASDHAPHPTPLPSGEGAR